MDNHLHSAADPLHVHVAEKIKERIAKDYAPGDVLPTHRQMAREYQVSLRTMAKAIELLTTLGIVNPIRRKGTVVNRRLELGERKLTQVGLLAGVNQMNLTQLRYLNEIVTSFLTEVRRMDVDIRVFGPSNSSQPDVVARAGIDALAVVMVTQESRLAELAQLNLPLVVMDYHTPQLPLDYVVCDNERAAAVLLEHLARLRHVRLAYVQQARASSHQQAPSFRHLVDNPDVREREQSFLAAVERLGLTFCGPVCHIWSHRPEPGPEFEDLCKVIRSPGGPTAVVTDDAAAASRLLECLRDVGIRVPQDVSVAAIALPGATEPAIDDLTGCHMGFTEMGRRAANLLEIRSRLPRPGRPNLVRVGFELLLGKTARPLN